jgi:hypothetical protein
MIGESAADAGVIKANAATDAAAKINLRMFPPAFSLPGARQRSPKPCQRHQYRHAAANAIAPLAGAILLRLLRCKMRHFLNCTSTVIDWRLAPTIIPQTALFRRPHHPGQPRRLRDMPERICRSRAGTVQ